MPTETTAPTEMRIRYGTCGVARTTTMAHYNARTDPSFEDAEHGRSSWSCASVYRFTDFSGWDVYRSQMALVGLLAPALSQDMAVSLLESGYANGTKNYDDREIPRWTTGYHETGVMIGDPGPPSVSSLFMFGRRSVSLTSMLEVLDLSSRHARINTNNADQVLEGAASDAAIAQMALWISLQDSLPRRTSEQSEKLVRLRTGSYRQSLESAGLDRVCKAAGGGYYSRSQEQVYGEFAEGNSIQYTFMIAHDVLGLKQKSSMMEKQQEPFSRIRSSPGSQAVLHRQAVLSKRIEVCSILASKKDWLVGILVSARWRCVF